MRVSSRASGSSSASGVAIEQDMDAREDKTIEAALRLFKSKLRLYAYQQRPTWEAMLPLEGAILGEAQADWVTLLVDWDRKNASDEIKLHTLAAEAFFRSLRDVVHFLEDMNGVEDILESLTNYAQDLGWKWALDEEAPCNSATS